MKKLSAKVLCAVSAVGLALVAGCSSSDGGDDATPGGGSSGAAGGDVTVAIVPKIQGVPFADALKRGGEDAGEEFGFTSLTTGPTSADPAAQADVVRSLIQQAVGAIVIAPNDPDSMGPVLKEAADRGIAVGTTDTDAPDSVREVFVNQATAEAIGTALTEQIAAPLGDKGNIAIVSCGQTAANLNSWIDVIKATVASDYPDITIVDTVYADEDEAKAVTMSKDLINAHPDLNGLVGVCTPTATGVAKAVQETGNVGKIFTTGVGTPNSMKEYLDSGASSASVLWDVENLGYLAAWAGWQLATGHEFQAENEVGRIGQVAYDADTHELILGDPLIITSDNVGDFSY